ncbi:MAG: hypothetical protein Q9P01_19025 [Anaerolineae bacterium]|nr:hypothetical protein [Anaerolineae bacterium]
MSPAHLTEAKCVINHTDEVIIHLTIDGELIETTPEHPFYTDEGEWVNATNLRRTYPRARWRL